MVGAADADMEELERSKEELDAEEIIESLFVKAAESAAVNGSSFTLDAPKGSSMVSAPRGSSTTTDFTGTDAAAAFVTVTGTAFGVSNNGCWAAASSKIGSARSAP